LEYYCPECGLTRDVGNSSMRAGDICPECRKGYITERQKSE
jgi:CRISPR/Cas system-associated protein Cas10 (large subunit of type III CRISPR-Cas system)